MVRKYTRDGWQVQITKTERGCTYEFQQQFTLTGAAQEISLNIPFPIELNRIEYFSDDAIAKSFDERIYSGNVDPSSYDQIVSVSNDINQAVAYYPTGAEGVYTQSPIIITTAVSASTAGKLLTKKILVRRL